MLREIKIVKMVASGNDFIVLEDSSKFMVHGLKSLVRKICDRKYGAGADGLLVLEKSKVADIKMRIFNADGSEAQMCGNGARCVALYSCQKNIKIETKAGIIGAQVSKDNVRTKLTDPKDVRLDMPLRVNGRGLKVNFINTGVPHAVVFVNGIDKIDVAGLGRIIRYHRKFTPAGTNVDFLEAIDNSTIKVRTYERGVEDETLACGTGSTASALIFALKNNLNDLVKVQTQSGEVLKVYFQRDNCKFNNVWLEGSVKKVYSGIYKLT